MQKRCSSASKVEKQSSLLDRIRKYSQSSNKSVDSDSMDEDISIKNPVKFIFKDRLLKQPSSSSIESDVFTESNSNKTCRIMFLGQSAVGKTTIIRKILNQNITEAYHETVQDMYKGELKMSNGVTFTMNIEDTGGSFNEEFPAMTSLSVKHSDLIVLVYNTADAASFEYIANIRETILEETRPGIPIVVVGNTVDQIRSPSLTFQEVEAVVCLDWEAGYVECSAVSEADDDNIESVLREIIVQTKMFPKGCEVLQKTNSSNKKEPFFKRMVSRDSFFERRKKHSSTDSEKY